MTRRGHVLLILALVLVLAGCMGAPTVEPPTPDPLDPDRELGVVDGIAADDRLDINASDGLTEAELEALVSRSMARVEVIREVRFQERPPVRVIDRGTFREGNPIRERPPPADDAWDNVIWKALFQIDQHTDAHEVFVSLYGGSVLGYFDPSSGEIVLIVNDDEYMHIDQITLAHELTHALQHQHVGIAYDSSTLDRQLAGQGLIEGEANYVEQEYEARCADGTWQCLERPPRGGSGGPVNLGLLVTMFHPYSDGPVFVETLIERGGWSAVDAAHERKPTSTTEIIHPDRYTTFEPTAVAIEDRSTDRWSRFEDLETRDDPGTTVGEAALFAMFWANGIVGGAELFESDNPRSPYNYAHAVTTGWTGDRLVPYMTADGDEAYVFETHWESDLEAGTFEQAYRALLENRHATAVDDDSYRIPDGRPFAGAYRIDRDDGVVTIVHAPSVEELDEVHPDGSNT